MAESLLVKQRLLILNRLRDRAPNLRASERILPGVCTLFMRPASVIRSAIVLRPSTILDFHRILRHRKYQWLFSPKRRRTGPKGPSKALMDARATYMPFPFQIIQGTDKITIAYEFSYATRVIHMDEVDPGPIDTWMGHSVGRWEEDTLVVDVTSQLDRTWFDRAGNFHSDALHVVERYTRTGPDHLRYEAQIEDSNVFTRPWTISMPLYRRIEDDAEIGEFRCAEFTEPFIYGTLSDPPLK